MSSSDCKDAVCHDSLLKIRYREWHLCCRYFLAPRNEIISDLQQSQQIMASEINDLNANKTALEKSLKGVEAELRELLTSSPALAQQLAQQEA